jgi:hypothetical protein
MAEPVRIAAIILALGVAFAGWQIGRGFAEGRSDDRYVVMKGLAERDVRADLAIWPLALTRTGPELATVQTGLEQDLAATTAFLLEQGFEEAEITRQAPQVTDLLAQPYRPEGAESNRFILSQTLLVRTADVERMLALSRDLGELVGRGVTVGAGGGPSSGPTYIFTRLNDIKPEMIAEATESARAAAEQFAEDSDSEVGAIRQASQGLFAIEPRDAVPGLPGDAQVDKRVRVVSTIEFFLDD